MSKKLTDVQRLRIKTGGLFTGARLNLGLTQGKIARKMGTKQPGIARWENGDILPSLKVLLKLARIQGKELFIDIR